MKVVDLTHNLNEKMPVYPGTPKPKFDNVYTFEEYKFREAKWTMFSHTGTHMDSPAHMELKGKTLDQFDIIQFIGRALVIHIRDLSSNIIEMKDLNIETEDLREAEFILIDTDWSKYWAEDRYFEEGPYLSIEVVRELMKYDLKGIGIDQMSIDGMNTKSFENHHEILSKNKTVIVENLKNLDKLPKWVEFMAFPINVENCDGSPIRAVARY
ncbi:MAG: cyclase family protein [Tissierellales bacterium]|jgi:kynurenine formamidase|nr:cyclase family protein [Tissierellales bacterium]